MKYTFLLPAYKTTFLTQALESIQKQTYDDYAVIISDDCSPEPIREVIQPFLTDSRFIYRRNDHNIGAEQLVSHWNILLQQCKSPYLIIAGDDDLYEPVFLEQMDRLVVKNPELYLYRCGVDNIDKEGNSFRTEPPSQAFEDQSAFIDSLFNDHLHGIGNYIFNTDFLKSVGGFIHFPLAWFSDDATALICSKNGVANSPDVLFHARISGMNISSIKPEYCILKMQSTILFYNWFRRSFGAPRGTFRLCRDHCSNLLWSYWKGLKARHKIRVVRTFPQYGWRILKERLANICS